MQAMAELGIDILYQRSKSVDALRSAEFDLVITVCYHAIGNCLLWLGPGRVKHMGFPDPAAATGSEAERLEVFARYGMISAKRCCITWRRWRIQ